MQGSHAPLHGAHWLALRIPRPAPSLPPRCARGERSQPLRKAQPLRRICRLSRCCSRAVVLACPCFLVTTAGLGGCTLSPLRVRLLPRVCGLPAAPNPRTSASSARVVSFACVFVSGFSPSCLRFSSAGLAGARPSLRRSSRVPARFLPPRSAVVRSAPSKASRPPLRFGLRSLRSLGRAVASCGRVFVRAGSLRSPARPLPRPRPPFFIALRAVLRLPAARRSRGFPPFGCAAHPLAIGCPASLSSSPLVAPAGAPRCVRALRALRLVLVSSASCVLARFACALPPRCGVPCRATRGIPAPCRECPWGLRLVLPLGLGRSSAPALWGSASCGFGGVLLVGLPPQTPLFVR